MSDLPLIAAILSSNKKEESPEGKVNHYFMILHELEKQAQQRNPPSMRDTINWLPKQD